MLTYRSVCFHVCAGGGGLYACARVQLCVGVYHRGEKIIREGERGIMRGEGGNVAILVL